jgi:DivIVA domain-containing protein
MVNQDDPEVRIAELERRLVEQKHVADPDHPHKRPAVTPADVHNVAFSKSARGKSGYDEDEVDAYLERIEATLRDPVARGGVTPADVHHVTFAKPAIGRRGYNEDQVDAFLARVAIELASRAGQRSMVDRGQRPAQDFGATTDLGPRHLRHSDESTPQTILGHILAFREELREHGGRAWTWRAPLVLGLLLGVVACIPPLNPLLLVAGVGFLIWAVLAWRFGWEF